MSCQLCAPAYEAGKRNGERAGKIAVVKELVAFAGTVADQAARLLEEGKIQEAHGLANSASAINAYVQDLAARVQKEFG